MSTGSWRARARGGRRPPRQAITSHAPPSAATAPAVEPDVELGTIDRWLRIIAAERGHPLLAWYLRDDTSLSPEVMPYLYAQLSRIGPAEHIDLLLYSTGGLVEMPVRIVPLIREFCQRWSVLVPYRAWSAATHVALGADEIVMGPLSELSPVDPQQIHPLLPRGKDADGNDSLVTYSVQDLKYITRFIDRQLLAQHGGEAIGAVLAELFRSIHPLALGALERGYELAKLVTADVLRTHLDDEAKIKELADTLSDRYRSHMYPITRREAKRLGLPVVDAAPALWQAMLAVCDGYARQTQATRELEPGLYGRFAIFLDTLDQRIVAEELFRRPSADEEEVVDVAWRVLGGGSVEASATLPSA